MQAHFVNVGLGNDMKGEKRTVLLAVLLTVRIKKITKNVEEYICKNIIVW